MRGLLENAIPGLGQARRGLGWLMSLPVLLLVGPIFFGAGLLIRSSTQPYDDGLVTSGEIVDIASRTDRDSDGDVRTMYTPIIEYTTADGREITFQTTSWSSSRPSVGATVEVSYRTNDPQGARNLSDSSKYFAWVFILIGLVLTLVAVGGLIAFVAALVGGATWLAKRRGELSNTPPAPATYHPPPAGYSPPSPHASAPPETTSPSWTPPEAVANGPRATDSSMSDTDFIPPAPTIT